MKNVILTLTLCVSAAGGLAGADETPKIQFDKTVYNFGKTSQVHQVAGTFIFTNVGDAVLKLDKPTTSCGCTVANLKTNLLKPGEIGELAFTLNVGPYRATLEKHIAVGCNDPKNPKVDLTVRAEYIPLFDLAPASMYMDNFRIGTSTNVSVAVSRTDGKQLVLTKVEPSKPWIHAKILSEKTNEQSGRISIDISPDGDPRRFYENVRVFTGDEKEQPFIINVQGRLVGDVACNPESLYWMIGPQSVLDGKVREPFANQRLIITATTPGKTMAITNLICSIKEIKAELKPIDKGKGFELLAKLTDVPAGTMSGTITFETDVPTQRKVTVPLTVSVIKNNETVVPNQPQTTVAPTVKVIKN